MDLWKKLLTKLRLFMATIQAGKFKSKPSRPRVQKILLAETVDDEIVLHERWIIVNSRGETLEAPIFSSRKEAEEWLDEFHPKQNYAPE